MPDAVGLFGSNAITNFSYEQQSTKTPRQRFGDASATHAGKAELATRWLIERKEGVAAGYDRVAQWFSNDRKGMRCGWAAAPTRLKATGFLLSRTPWQCDHRQAIYPAIADVIFAAGRKASFGRNLGNRKSFGSGLFVGGVGTAA